MEKFLDTLPFALDEFQLEAIGNIADGHSVVVCAPTGSGKTIVAEYAVFKALEAGKRVFYTTPLKALSNQKFHDFRKAYGEDRVGLLTGDISVNRDAPIIVMTTEIFRNMLYGHVEDSSLLADVGYVVLDECHYMNDAERGTVWEESIIYCPESIQIVALSATIANAQELTDWINEVHHDTRLIQSDYRPVPLRFFYFTRKDLLPLYEAPGQMNRKLKFDIKGNRFSKKNREYNPNPLIMDMYRRDMLPAIFFTFSRMGCDKAMRNTRDLQLLTPQERQTLKQKIAEFVEQHPFLHNNPNLRSLENGVASHHAGLLPGLKVLVEQLFQQGLIKVVFATETLAAGINMPARSTVITALSKRTDDGHRLLTASEFLQMSGRAGRRGMDEVGYVVIISSPWEGAAEAARLADSTADPLNSRFTPTYGMVLNLLQRYTLEEAHYLISRSFGQFTWERRMAPLEAEIAETEARYHRYMSILESAGLSEKEFGNLLKTRSMLNESHRFIRALKRQIKQYGKQKDIMTQLAQEEAKRKNLEKSLKKAPVDIYQILSKHKHLDVKISRSRKQLKHLKARFENEKDIYWRRFTSIYNLLKEAAYLNANDRPTEQGVITSRVRAENEFAVTEVINRGILNELSPSALAGVICAMTNDSNRENLYANLDHSPQAQQAMFDILKELKRITKLQERHGVDVPVLLNPVASGLVEAWAEGLPWERLMGATNISEGDLVRIIRRSADLLRQLSHIEGIPEELVRNARNAAKLIVRDPVKEVDMPTAATAEDEAAIDEAIATDEDFEVPEAFQVPEITVQAPEEN